MTESPFNGELNDVDRATLKKLKEFPSLMENEIEHYCFRAYSQEVINLARLGNKYLAEQEPWKLIKTDPKRVETIMFTALQISSCTEYSLRTFTPIYIQKAEGHA